MEEVGISSTVAEGGEEPIFVFVVSHEGVKHEFKIGESRFSYVRVNGKAKEISKEFHALSTEFWIDFHMKKANTDKHDKAMKTHKRDNASYKIYLHI